MLSKCKAIVIKTVNYSESSVVAKCYTNVFGLQSYLINGVRTRKGAIRPSHLLPLSLLELEVYHQQNKNLQRIKELKCQPVLKTLHVDFTKSAIGMFMAELLAKTIREENHTDENLFEFLFASIQILDLATSSCANFPCYFMLRLSQHLGFLPKGIFDAQHNSLDLQEGVFTQYYPGISHIVSPQVSQKIYLLLHSTFENCHLQNLTHDERKEVLDVLVYYYRLHITGLAELTSHKVLAEVLK